MPPSKDRSASPVATPSNKAGADKTAGRRRLKTWIFGATMIAMMAGSALFWRWNTQATRVSVHAELPADFPPNSFSHESFETLLTHYVDDGRVDYAAWHKNKGDRVRLDQYLAAVAAYSPENAPSRFLGKHDKLAYWMYAYNAFVIKAVLDRWPLQSVTDVKAPVEIVKGLGFFYTLKFVAGGADYTLYAIEHDKVIKPSQDPRVHFVLNCASGSCPAIRPKLPKGDDLERYLQQGAADFVNDAKNVTIDNKGRRIILSRIFEWYEDEFVDEVRRRGLPTERGIIEYIVLVAPESLRKALDGSKGYKIEFRDYDWAINDTNETP